MNTCNLCNFQASSKSYLYLHKREQHSYFNCLFIKCSLCLKEFYSPIINQKRNEYALKCENCRQLQKTLNTNDLILNTFVYDKQKRYLVCQGFVKEVCNIYTCNNDIKCIEKDSYEK